MKPKLGVVGLGAMGSGLAINLARNVPGGVVVLDRDPVVTEQFAGRKEARDVRAVYSYEEFGAALDHPCLVVVMVNAGSATDDVIQSLSKVLVPGDVIADCGNSHYRDTLRRQEDLDESGIHLLGVGVSGGKEGALSGPSMMVGGPREAWDSTKHAWRAVAAVRDEVPCVEYFGPAGAGHFVKMVHNGIEYAEMQMLSEAYGIIRHIGGLDAASTADLIEEWQDGLFGSFLGEAAIRVLRHTDPGSGLPLVDLIDDAAAAKGTGSWTVSAGLEIGVDVGVVAASVFFRSLSANQTLRSAAHERWPNTGKAEGQTSSGTLEFVRSALICGRIVAYAQGLDLIREQAKREGWETQISDVVRVWGAGSIIRSRLLDAASSEIPDGREWPSAMLWPTFSAALDQNLSGLRRCVSEATRVGTPVPALSSSLAYFDSARARTLPSNLIQAQRDLFGAHGYARTDRGGVFHTEW